MSKPSLRVGALLLILISFGFAAEPAQLQSPPNSDEIDLAIAARIDDRGRVEFGVIPPGGQAFDSELPSARFLPLNLVQSRTSWRSSSPVTIWFPGQDPERLTVRVAARGTGDDTVEFALQLQDDAGAWGPRLSPTRRILPFSVPVGRWFRSTPVRLDFSPPAPTIDEILCSPESPRATEQLTCRAEVSGEFTRYAWSARSGAHGGSRSTFSTSFPTAGHWTVQLTVEGPGGSTTATRSLYVQPPLPPVVEAITCLPTEVFIGDPVTCRAQVRGIFDELTWDFPDNVQLNNKEPFTIELPAEGSYRIAVIATGPGGDSMERETLLTVVSPPRIEAVDCLPKAPEIGETVTCTASVTGSNVSYHWDATGSPSTGSEPVFQTSFDSEGGQIIALRIVGRAGDDSSFDSVSVGRPGPQIQQITCTATPEYPDDALRPDGTSPPRSNYNIYSCHAEVDESAGRVTESAWWSADSGVRKPREFDRYANNNPSFRILRSRTSILFVYTVRGANGSIDTAFWMDRGAPREDGAHWAPNWCAPVLPARGETLTCGRIGSLYQGRPPSRIWWRVDAGHPDLTDSAIYRTYFTTSGFREVYGGYRYPRPNDVSGANRLDLWIADNGPIAGPTIEALSCDPVGGSANEPLLLCSATVGGGPIDSYHWRNSGSYDRDPGWRQSETLTIRRFVDGPRTYILVVKGPGGSDVRRIRIPGKP
ncbi:MAG: hypothetical protein F4038_02085 [Chloroflexi bacterium]|nr:hypothetical protein [Chloroflexota bacterium]MYJ91829.1 hypothetical protein [Chloroflexota bacterium]